MPRHVVVDGSNLATEGRSQPSLKQLSDAVTAFMAEHPTDLITVVVDATFGHRIDSKETAEFEAAIEHNELVAPPAGAIGRGDAFVLSIASKVGATILTNDSYQEFHADYPWLFDEGRLIGGKPVPNIGWVFVHRSPVRGPVSRRATREKKAKSTDTGSRSSSKAASQPMPVPKAPPPGSVLPTKPARKGRERDAEPKAASGHVNDLLAFLGFVEKHPVGTSVNAIVESYSSHGAYVTIGDVRGYVPLRLMADPPPRSAREAMAIGESVTLVVASFAPARRSIDLTVPHLAAVVDEVAPAKVAPRKAAGRKKAAAPQAAPKKAAASTKAAAKKAPTKKAATAPKDAKKAPAKKAATPPKDAAAKKAPAKRAVTPPKDAGAKKVTAPPKAEPAKKAPAKKTATPQKAPTKKAAPKKAAPKKVAPKKAPAKKTPASRAKA
jgi:hypothetical protein